MEKHTIRLPESLNQRLEQYIQDNHYPNRSEALRNIIRTHLNNHDNQKGDSR